MQRSLMAILFGAAAIVGCTTSGQMSRSDYNELSAHMRNDPKLKRLIIEDCAKKLKPKGSVKELAAAMNVDPQANVKLIYCKRLMTAVASGDFTYEDYVAYGRLGKAQ